MSWSVEYSAPSNLVKTAHPTLEKNPIAAVHDMIRRAINNSKESDNTVATSSTGTLIAQFTRFL